MQTNDVLCDKNNTICLYRIDITDSVDFIVLFFLYWYIYLILVKLKGLPSRIRTVSET